MDITAQEIADAQALISSSMGRFLPELILSGLVVFLLLHDVFSRGVFARRPAWIAAGGLVLAGALLLRAWPEASVPLFGWKSGLAHKSLMADDGFGRFFKLFTIVGTLVTIPMCLMFPQFQKRRMGEFYALLVAASLGMMLMAGATNLLMIYLGIEFASMASYLATSILKQERRGSEAGLKYVIYGSMASGVMIFGMSFVYGLTGSLSLDEIAQTLVVSGANQKGLVIAGVLVFAGFAYKMAAFPMHFWCPDVYEGSPVPFTAYLSVTSKAAGFAVLVRFLMAFGVNFDLQFKDYLGALSEIHVGWPGLIAGASALSMTVGNLAALWQKNLKRLLAYSSVAHAGYLLMGVAALSPQEGGSAAYGPLLFYFIAYFFMNLGGFYVITIVASKTGREDVDGYKGLGLTSPVLGACLTLCLISLLGVPPTVGFAGKLQLFQAVIDRGFVWLAIVAGINTAISAYYYFRVIKAMYLDEPEGNAMGQASLGATAIVALLTAPVLVLGLAFGSVAEFTRNFGL